MPQAQLAIYGILLLSLAVAVIAGVKIVLRRKQKAAHRVGLSALRELQALLAYMQQHRGMTNGVLHGDEKLRVPVQTLRKKVIAQIDHIESTSTWLKDSSQWQIITEEWAKLSSEFASKNSDVNFNNHCTMVQLVLDAIINTADYYGLSQVQRILGNNSAAYLWRELLMVAELMGQARALGIGVAVDGFSTTETKDRLRHLILEIEMASDLLVSYMPDAEATHKQLESFSEVVENYILVPRPTISAMDFFRTASGPIDVLYQHYNQQMRRLTEMIFRYSG